MMKKTMLKMYDCVFIFCVLSTNLATIKKGGIPATRPEIAQTNDHVTEYSLHACHRGLSRTFYCLWASLLTLKFYQ